MYLLERKEATYENLRDLNFEYKAGKLSEQDYAIQRASLEDEAAAILAEMESIEKARAVVRKGTRRPTAPDGGARERRVGMRPDGVRWARGSDSTVRLRFARGSGPPRLNSNSESARHG